MRFYSLLAFVLLSGFGGFAQVLAPVSRPDSLATAAPAHPAPDTLAAIHKLFATRRRQQVFGALSIVAATAVGIAIISATAQSSSGAGGGAYGLTVPNATNDGPNTNALGVGILAIPVLAGELFYFDRYNREHERQAAAAFNAHRLPGSLRRKLKPRFFR